jgi:hypothetical protein
VGYGFPGFDFRQRKKIFHFSTATRPALGPTQPPIQWVPEVPSLGVKQRGREADHSPISNADVKNRGAIPPFPHKFSWRDAYTIKNRDDFTFKRQTQSVTYWVMDLRLHRILWRVRSYTPLIRRVLVRMIGFISTWLHTHS